MRNAKAVNRAEKFAEIARTVEARHPDIKHTTAQLRRYRRAFRHLQAAQMEIEQAGHGRARPAAAPDPVLSMLRERQIEVLGPVLADEASLDECDRRLRERVMRQTTPGREHEDGAWRAVWHAQHYLILEIFRTVTESEGLPGESLDSLIDEKVRGECPRLGNDRAIARCRLLAGKQQTYSAAQLEAERKRVQRRRRAVDSALGGDVEALGARAANLATDLASNMMPHSRAAAAAEAYAMRLQDPTNPAARELAKRRQTVRWCLGLSTELLGRRKK